MKKLRTTAAVNFALAIGAATTSIVLARFFGAELRGLYSVITALVNTSVSVAVLGTPAYVARMVANEEQHASIGDINLRHAMIAIIVISSLAAFGLASLINWDSRLIELDWALSLLLAAYIPLSVASVLMLTVSLGQANWFGFNIGRLVFVLGTVIGVTLYYFAGGQHLVGIVGSLVVANIATVSIQWVIAKPIPLSIGSWHSTVWRLYYRSRYYALNSISNISTGYVDFLVLSFLFEASLIGFWAVARTLAALLSPVNNALSVVVFSGFMRREIGDIGGFRTILRNFLFFNALSALFFIIFAEEIINFVFGAEFSNSVPLVPMALASVVGASAGELFEERLRGAGRPGPVNVSRFTPLVFLLGIVAFSQQVTSVTIFATVFAIGQIVRALLAVLMVRLFHVQEGREVEVST